MLALPTLQVCTPQVRLPVEPHLELVGPGGWGGEEVRRQEDLGDRQRGVQGGLLPGEGGGGPVQGGGRGLHLEKKEGVRESSLDTSDPREVTMAVSSPASCLATRLEGCTTKLSEEREKEGWAIRSLGPGGLIRGGGGGGGGREGGGEGGSGGVSMRTFKLELGHSLGHEHF